MGDRPRHGDWWLASDGKWYPPELSPSEEAVAPTPERSEQSGPVHRLTTVLATSLSVTSALFGGAAYWALRYGSALKEFSGDISDFDRESLAPTELAWAGWTAFALLMLAASGVLLIVWAFRVSKILDFREPEGRRWRGWWVIGGWFIPFANLVLPKLMFNELERVAQVPVDGLPVGDRWRAFSQSRLSDAWWFLWLAGVLPSQIVQLSVGDPGRDAARLSTIVNASAFSYVMFVGAGLLLAMLVRRIEQLLRN